MEIALTIDCAYDIVARKDESGRFFIEKFLEVSDADRKLLDRIDWSGTFLDTWDVSVEDDGLRVRVVRDHEWEDEVEMLEEFVETITRYHDDIGYECLSRK
jgi:hypothetical protein